MSTVSPNDDQYRLPGTNIFNWSAYSRENIPKPPAQCKVGDEVVVVGVDEVKSIYPDCDGTPLYETHNHGPGFSDASVFAVPSDFEWQADAHQHQELIAALRAKGWTIEPPKDAVS